MAKIKLGAIVTAISGKLGGHVFAKNRGGAYMRTNATPTNPQTSAQTLVRAIMASISSLWSTLTSAQRTSWNAATESFARTDQFGDIRQLSGKALFQSLNQNLELTGQAQITVAPQPVAVPALLITEAKGQVVGATFDITNTGDTTGSKLMVFATPVLSQGTSFVKNKLRKLQVTAGGNAVDVDIFAAYTAKYGALVAGTNIYIGVKVINAQGQASPMEVVKALIIA